MKKIILIVLFIFINTIHAQDFWKQTNGPLGTSIYCISESPSGQLFVGTGNGLYSSIDNGNSWSRMKNNIETKTIMTMAFNSNGHMFAGSSSGVVYKSTNGGENWVASFYDTKWIDWISSIVVNPAGFIFAGTSGGIYRSTDNGATWEKKSGIITEVGISGFTLDSSGTLFVSAPGGVFYTNDNGDNWQNLIDTAGGRVPILITKQGDIFINGMLGGVMRSKDKGKTWEETNNGIQQLPFRYPLYRKWRDITSLSTDSSGNLYAGTTYAGTTYPGLYRSTDNGDNWEFFDKATGNICIRKIYTTKNGNVYVGTEGLGLYRSTDNGLTWLNANKDFFNTHINTLCVNKNRDVFAGSYKAGVFRSTDNGNNWNQINRGLPEANINSLGIGPYGNLVVASLCFLYRSTDNGNTWFNIDSGNFNYYGNNYSMITDSSGYIYVDKDYTIVRTTDNGLSWEAIGTGGAMLGLNTNGILFTNSWEKNILYRYSDSGKRKDALVFSTKGDTVNSIAFNNKGHIFIGTQPGGVYRSTDNGNNWTSVNKGLINLSVQSLVISPSGEIFAGTQDGVFNSTDNGDSWTEVSLGLTDRNVLSFVISPDGFIYAGTNANGVFRSINSITKIETSETKAKIFALHQNYPNPFNPTTTIKYSVGSHQFVSLKVFDVLGNEVSTLVNEEKSAGNYSVDFNASHLSSGVYFYTLKAGSFVESKKMIFLK